MTKERTEMAEMLGNLLADDNFFQLDQRINTPNIFSILNMEYQKSNYNSILGYLLNAHENHGLEDSFLRMFLSKALEASPVAKEFSDDELSPIPYETVKESILDWDQLDVLSADLRDTMVQVNYPLGDEGRTVDLCIWNDSYNFVIYVENKIIIREGWRRYHGTARRLDKSHSREYLLDLYKQWATEESGKEYEILPVFLAFGDDKPDEKYLTRIIDYDWMVDVLKQLESKATISAHGHILINDFMEFIKKERADILDLPLYNKLETLSDLYGPSVCRLYDHVAECNGCDSDDELIIAFHDIYRRHKDTIDLLWLFADSREFSILNEIESEIRGLEEDKNLQLLKSSSTISGISRKWLIKDSDDGAEDQETLPLCEVYFSASVGTCGMFIYQEPSKGMINKIWMIAQELADEREMKLSPRKPSSRNFHLAKISYNTFNPLSIARDFVRFYQMLNDIMEELIP